MRFIKALQDRPSSIELKQVRSFIIKYSLFNTTDDERKKLYSGRLAQHRDLRQALHLSEIVLNTLHGSTSQQIDSFREWLMYRRVRILGHFDPDKVEGAVQALEREYPTSTLLDDAYAELLYAQAFVLRVDPVVVSTTFHLIAERFPKENAVDNAYTWYAIYLECIKNDHEAARSLNFEILSRFPASRHAISAATRLANSPGCQTWQHIHSSSLTTRKPI
jgi:hypothetical protein